MQNLLIQVTDRELIERTGGIVQGMSGSPILQNGKLIGAPAARGSPCRDGGCGGCRAEQFYPCAAISPQIPSSSVSPETT